MIFLRLKVSAKWPAGTVNRIMGSISDRPTMARANAECVRWYSSQSIATTSICWPSDATNRPVR